MLSGVTTGLWFARHSFESARIARRRVRRVLIPLETVVFCLALLYAAVKLLSWSESSALDERGDRRAYLWVGALFVWHAIGWLLHLFLLNRVLRWQFGELDVNPSPASAIAPNPAAAATATAAGSTDSAPSEQPSTQSQQQSARSSHSSRPEAKAKTLSESSDSSSEVDSDSDFERKELLSIRRRAQRRRPAPAPAAGAAATRRRKRLNSKELKKKKEKRQEKKLRVPPLKHLWKIACLMRDDLHFLIPGFIFLILAAIGTF